MKTFTFAINSAVFVLTLLTAQVSYSASQQQAVHISSPHNNYLEMQAAETFQAKDKAQDIAKNSNGRRCRWVKGIGIVCDGGRFGTFSL